MAATTATNTSSYAAPPARDNTQRFTGRADAYNKFRDSYAPETIAHAFAALDLPASATVLDMGSGTGILSAAVLAQQPAATLVGLEPNDDMRAYQEKNLADPIAAGRFRSVKGTAEESTLPAGSADAAFAAAAFHWFDAPRARAEVMRVVRSSGGRGAPVALFTRAPLREGEAPLVASGSPEVQAQFEVVHAMGRFQRDSQSREKLSDEALDAFFGGRERWTGTPFPSVRRMDWEHMRGWLASVSFFPREGSDEHAPLMREVRKLFDLAQEDGRMAFNHVNRMICGFVG